MNLNRKSGIPKRLTRRSIRKSIKYPDISENEYHIEIKQDQIGALNIPIEIKEEQTGTLNKQRDLASFSRQINQKDILNNKFDDFVCKGHHSKISHIKKPKVVNSDKPEINDEIPNKRKSILKANKIYDLNGMLVKENKVITKCKSVKTGSKLIKGKAEEDNEELMETMHQLLMVIQLGKENLSNILENLNTLDESI